MRAGLSTGSVAIVLGTRPEMIKVVCFLCSKHCEPASPLSR